MKNKTIMIICLSLMALLVTIQFSYNVNATTVILTNFDDVSSGLDSGTSLYIDFENIGTANYGETSTSYDYSAPNSFHGEVDGSGYCNAYLNLTQNFTSVSKISYTFYHDNSGSLMYFKFFDTLGNNVINTRWNSNQWGWYETSVGWHNLGIYSGRYFVNITWLGTNQFNVILEYGGSEELNQDYAGQDTGIFNNISYMTFYALGTGSNSNIYLDDISLIYSGGGGCSNPTGNELGGILTGQPNSIIGLADNKIEYDYANTVTGTMTGFKLWIGLTQLSAYNSGTVSLSDYTLYVNGLNKGHPSCIKTAYGLGALVWTFSPTITLNNDILIFELKADTKYSGNLYWELAQATYSNEDLDGDGDSNIYYGTWQSYDANGLIDSNYYGWDIFYSFYISNLNPLVNPYDEHDYLELRGWYTKNSTHYKYRQYSDSVLMAGIISNLEDTRSVRIYNYSSDTLLDEFYITDKYDFFFSYQSLTVGNTYNASLMDGSTFVTSLKFSIIHDDTSYNYSVWSNPVTSYGYTPYTINWRYFNPDGKDGILACWDIPNANNINTAIYTKRLQSNSTGNDSMFIVSTDSNHYWKLFIISGSNYFQVGQTHKHYIIPINAENIIYTIPENVIVNEEFLISGTHVFPSFDIRVFLNNKYISNVDLDTTFNIAHTVSTSGSYIISLRYYLLNGSYVELDDYTFSASYGTGGESGTILPPIAQPLGSIVGMIVTLFCLLIPFIVSGVLRLSHGLPPVTYAFTGGLGLAISTVLGFFPIWIPLFVLICGVIFLMVQYLKGTQFGGNTGG